MASTTQSLSDVIADGRWLAHRYDETADTVHFRLVPREAQQSVIFLTEGEIGETPIAVFPREACLAEGRRHALPTPRFIFHSAYCCSTLLARAFDIPGTAFGLKEPQILNDVVGLQLRGGDPRQVAAAMDIALLLLARPLADGEVNVVKPSNLVNPLIPLIAALRPDVRGVLLHAPLAVFLNSVARKEIEGRAWVRELLWKLIQLRLTDRFGLSNEELFRQTDLQVAATGWLAQQALFADIAQQHSGFRTLDSETLTARPVECLKALGELFDFDLDAEAIAAGPAFRTHSKDRGDFSADRRAEERAQGEALHAREVDMVLEWVTKLAEHADVPMDLPSPLIGRE